MRKSQNIRTYAFLPHDLPMKFSLILPFLTRFRKKRRVAALQLDLRRNATRCTLIIAEENRDFKRIFEEISSQYSSAMMSTHLSMPITPLSSVRW